jgi:very-short-patch-repair endonuclease
MTATLHWGKGASVSHRSAAALWTLTGFEPGTLELTIPRSRKGRGPGIVHGNLLLPVDMTVVQAIPVTTAARTLIDVAPFAPEDRLEEALDDALYRGLFSIPRLRWRLGELARSGRPGVVVIRKLLDARSPSERLLQSVFERRLLRLFRRAGLPEPVLQYEVRYQGRLIAIVDFAYPDARLAIEADGEAWHSGHFRRRRDRTRGNRLTALGWRVIHITWEDLMRRPETIVEMVRKALRLTS